MAGDVLFLRHLKYAKVSVVFSDIEYTSILETLKYVSWKKEKDNYNNRWGKNLY